MENITPRKMEIRQTGLRTYQVEVKVRKGDTKCQILF